MRTFPINDFKFASNVYIEISRTGSRQSDDYIFGDITFHGYLI